MSEALSNLLMGVFIPVAATVLTAILLYVIKLLIDIKKGVDQHNIILYGDKEMKGLSVGLMELTIEDRKALIQLKGAILILVQQLIQQGTLNPTEAIEDIICILKACMLDEPSIKKD